MINIRDAKTVRYANDTRLATVYPDFSQSGMWYIVPEPLFAKRTVAGREIPVFSLVEYTTQSGDVMATCTFTVRLDVSPEALAAVRAAIPGATFGQLDWISSAVTATFSIEGQEYVFLAEPSMAGTNEATFIIPLESQAMVNFFKANFGPNAPATSGLSIDYDVTTLAKLQAVKATVSFNSDQAYEYEKTVDVKKNMWGSVTERKTTIRQSLNASEAGSTEIDYNIENPSEEFKRRIENWAFKALESLVDQAVETAANTLGPGNADRMSAKFVASFSKEYKENQVIEWVISPQQQLPADEISANWGEHYSTADFRRLITNFNILGDLKDAEVESVNLSAVYHGTTKTHEFKPGASTQWTFDVDGQKDGGGHFDPEYEFTYKVTLTDGQSFEVGPEKTADTNISIGFSDLGLVKVNFSGDALDFDVIDKVGIDFMFNTPLGAPNVRKYEEITKEKSVAKFKSDTSLHLKNFDYYYRLTYHASVKPGEEAKDGGGRATYVMAPIVNSGGKAKTTVLLEDPFQEVSYGIVTSDSNDSDKKVEIEQVLLTATYDDDINGMNFREQVQFKTEDTQFQDITLLTVDNPNGSYVRLNGLVRIKDGPSQPVRDVYVPGRSSFLEFVPGRRQFSAKFDATLVDWETVQLVKVDAFTVLPEQVLSRHCTANEIEHKKDLVQSISFGAQPKQEDGTRLPTPDQFFTFSYPEGQSPSYYYEVTYYHVGKAANTHVAEVEGDLATVILPRDGNTPDRVVMEAVADRHGAFTVLPALQ
ncbi:hypothetical protein [Tateyamaria sp. syn59]|uniref:hypothetical protein n=1 Tax=Tateyamaria sp. syn59 TaxID=2576942 RepID=UPI0011BD8253|nr:hypothetical protein [Tateyamaria sp. syn59]